MNLFVSGSKLLVRRQRETPVNKTAQERGAT